MDDRLGEIKAKAVAGYWPSWAPREAAEDIAWLIAENERLTAEVAYMRDHPGWVPPILPEQKWME